MIGILPPCRVLQSGMELIVVIYIEEIREKVDRERELIGIAQPGERTR